MYCLSVTCCGTPPGGVRRLLAAALVLLAASVFADAGPARPTGLLVSPKTRTLRATRARDVKRGPLLRAADEPLPSRFDAREQGWLTPVRHQGDLGTCWSFAALATVETQLLKSGRGSFDLSEKNLVNHRAVDVPFKYGAYQYTASGYLLRWSGPVLEEYDAYAGTVAGWSPSPALRPALHIQSVVWVPPLDGTEEARAELKAAIRDYGAVATSIGWYSTYRRGAAYYCEQKASANHAITAVGWDDDYPADAFHVAAPGDGAWIVKNSWGTSNGEQGYFYVSYYDMTFGGDGHYNGCVYIPAPEDGTCDYDAVHGYDCAGPAYDTSGPLASPVFSNDLQAVVFTAARGETLAAVGLWTRVWPKPYELTVYTNVVRTAEGAPTPDGGGAAALVQRGTLTRAGFTAVPLEAEIPLAEGTGYAIVYRQTGDEDISTVVATDIAAEDDPVYGRYRFTRGNGYIGWTEPDGSVTWKDAVDAGIDDAFDPNGWALCIKAYTRYAAAAPAGDMPGTAEDGTAMLVALEARDPALFRETFAFGPLAALVGANGRSCWANWLFTDFDPALPPDDDFRVYIDASGDAPRVSWKPDLGERRAYTLWGRDSLAPGSVWREVDRDAPGATGARFFRVSVRVP